MLAAAAGDQLFLTCLGLVELVVVEAAVQIQSELLALQIQVVVEEEMVAHLVERLEQTEAQES
jgi:hypothetical protein